MMLFGILFAFWTCGSHVLIVFLLLGTVLYHSHIRAHQMYMVYSLARVVNWTITIQISLNVLRLIDTYVTIGRIKKFLLLEELEQETLNESSGLRPRPEDCYVELKNATAKWDQDLDQNTLEEISVRVNPGKLLAVIGPVGAGKSSLLMSVLRELPVSSGSVNVRGKISYISQQPWVFSASLRQNIVFGNKFDGDRYNRIIRACALKKDIELMPNGDSTLIGDRGVSLSGGQRARVSLARALYMDADVYLLDDPLSAVDSAVSRHLFEKVIQGMLRHKPRILVTHQLHFLKEADEILILKEGKCLGQGTFEDISTSGIDFSSLLKTNKEEEEETESEAMIVHSQESQTQSLQGIGSNFSLASIGTEFEPDPVQLPEEEVRKEGTVGWKVYYHYFKAGAGVFKFLVLILLNLIAQGSYVISDWWLSLWANAEEQKQSYIQIDSSLRQAGHNITNITIPIVDTHFYVYVYSGIIGAVFLFGLLRALMFFKVAVDASKCLHNRMFNRLLRAPIRFFDTNPVGRVLNRFSKDTGHMDDQLPITFYDFLQCLLLIIGIVIVVGVVIPYVFIVMVPICILLYITRKYHITTSRHIKRLEGTTRSPVFSHLSASLQGLHTIRALRVQDKFMEEFDNHQNLHTESWFLFLSSSRWLAIRLDWMCAIFVTAVSFCCVILAKDISAGLVGLSLTYAMTLMGMFQWAVRQSAEVESQMISVERVLEYSKLEIEAELESDNPPPPEWPEKGMITTQNAKLRYSPNGPWVFKGLNFEIKEKEKVGLVGRTGAGKSSIISMMFRMADLEGCILIDNIDIQKIGLHELRNKISIIPQDPVLFTGPLRKNLDPFDELTDEMLWKALEEVQLKPAIEDLPGQLDSEVSEGGINFSVGQRQLICLARAILRKNRILMIDEATANVDPRTDGLIQKTIREKFKHCTVITIAHRLNTIMDSDRVMVLDEGEVVEFNHPYDLLQDTNGYFYNMVQQTGKTETQNLMEIAKSTHNSFVNPYSLSDRGKELLHREGDIAADDIYLSAVDLDMTSTTDSQHLQKVSSESSGLYSSAVDLDTADAKDVKSSSHQKLFNGYIGTSPEENPEDSDVQKSCVLNKHSTDFHKENESGNDEKEVSGTTDCETDPLLDKKPPQYPDSLMTSSQELKDLSTQSFPHQVSQSGENVLPIISTDSCSEEDQLLDN